MPTSALETLWKIRRTKLKFYPLIPSLIFFQDFYDVLHGIKNSVLYGTFTETEKKIVPEILKYEEIFLRPLALFEKEMDQSHANSLIPSLLVTSLKEVLDEVVPLAKLNNTFPATQLQKLPDESRFGKNLLNQFSWDPFSRARLWCAVKTEKEFALENFSMELNQILKFEEQFKDDLNQKGRFFLTKSFHPTPDKNKQMTLNYWIAQS